MVIPLTPFYGSNNTCVVPDTSHFTVPNNDRNIYVLGSIDAHNLVMACLPAGAYGTNSAANVASNMLRTFPSLRIWFMVGVGAGVPGRVRDIRLGDVAVSTTIWQYDLGKTVQGGRDPAHGCAMETARRHHDCGSGPEGTARS